MLTLYALIVEREPNKTNRAIQTNASRFIEKAVEHQVLFVVLFAFVHAEETLNIRLVVRKVIEVIIKLFS